jgi:hypothetical protein
VVSLKEAASLYYPRRPTQSRFCRTVADDRPPRIIAAGIALIIRALEVGHISLDCLSHRSNNPRLLRVDRKFAAPLDNGSRYWILGMDRRWQCVFTWEARVALRNADGLGTTTPPVASVLPETEGRFLEVAGPPPQWGGGTTR